ncbi:MAG TPA: hypothetical protein VMJ35_07045 [Dongiaceae bacterium]|nr:hypothetical protein [Dongiaceae bacterium]
MNLSSRGLLRLTTVLAVAAVALLPNVLQAQNTSKSDQWIHVRVENKDEGGETVRVNVPIDMAVKVLPAIRHNQLHDGKVRLDCAHFDDVDLKAMLDAIRTSKDGEYVTVQGNEDDVRVAKNAGYLYIHVTEKKHGVHSKKNGDAKESAASSPTRESKVEVKVPMKVVDALFSTGTDELDIVAALRALSSTGDTELVSVKDSENTVRVWIDSKNVTD